MAGFQDVAPEQLAKLFFHYREALAPDFPYTPPKSLREDSHWETIHPNERNLLVATARFVLLELACIAHHNQDTDDGNRDKNPTNTGRVEGSEGKECGC